MALPSTPGTALTRAADDGVDNQALVDAFTTAHGLWPACSSYRWARESNDSCDGYRPQTVEGITVAGNPVRTSATVGGPLLGPTLLAGQSHSALSLIY